MDIYIKRERDISLQEWVDYIKTDSDLTLAESAEGINPITKQKLKMKIEGRALFGETEMIYKNGCIGCDDYSEDILMKCKEIAKMLNAEVFD
ncbi:MAG: hypothetical protein J6D08_02135 [Lachnospiraceae bacterium]|nr:hypothetical protein [Lachnospiraceae bacterium]